MDIMETNSNYVNNQICLRRTSIKRKLNENLRSNLKDYQDKTAFIRDENDNHKKFKNLESTKLNSLEVQQTQSNTCSKKKALKSKYQRKKSLLKSSQNSNNSNRVNFFDPISAYHSKFQELIKKVFEKIEKSSLDAYRLDDKDKDKDNIFDLNKLFQFDDANTQTISEQEDKIDNLLSSFKASFLGKGSFGRVFKTKLNSKCFAIKIGLSNSCFGCTGEQNALDLNDHPNVVKTHHILKLKIKSTDSQLFKDEFPVTMNENISHHTMKYIIDLNLLKLIDLFPKYKCYSTLNVILMEFAGDLSLQQLIDDSTNQTITKGRRIHFAKQVFYCLKNKN